MTLVEHVESVSRHYQSGLSYEHSYRGHLEAGKVDHKGFSVQKVFPVYHVGMKQEQPQNIDIAAQSSAVRNVKRTFNLDLETASQIAQRIGLVISRSVSETSKIYAATPTANAPTPSLAKGSIVLHSPLVRGVAAHADGVYCKQCGLVSLVEGECHIVALSETASSMLAIDEVQL